MLGGHGTEVLRFRHVIVGARGRLLKRGGIARAGYQTVRGAAALCVLRQRVEYRHVAQATIFAPTRYMDAILVKIGYIKV